MSLPIKTCVWIADLPSTAGSLQSDTGSTQLLSTNGCSPSLPSRRTWFWLDKPLLIFSKFAQSKNPGRPENNPLYCSPIPHQRRKRNSVFISTCKEGLGWANQLDLGNSMQLFAGSNHSSNRPRGICKREGKNMASNSVLWSIAIINRRLKILRQFVMKH